VSEECVSRYQSSDPQRMKGQTKDFSICVWVFVCLSDREHIQGLDLVLWIGGMGVNLSHFPGYLCFFTCIKTSSRHLSARPKVDLAVLVDILGHLSHFI
jgi:hypothetical protein